MGTSRRELAILVIAALMASSHLGAQISGTSTSSPGGMRDGAQAKPSNVEPCPAFEGSSSNTLSDGVCAALSQGYRLAALDALKVIDEFASYSAQAATAIENRQSPADAIRAMEDVQPQIDDLLRIANIRTKTEADKYVQKKLRRFAEFSDSLSRQRAYSESGHVSDEWSNVEKLCSGALNQAIDIGDSRMVSGYCPAKVQSNYRIDLPPPPATD